MRKFKIIILLLVIILIVENMLSAIYPINSWNLDTAKEKCAELNLIEVKSNGDNENVTREEFLNAVLKTIGVNEYIINTYYNANLSMSPNRQDFQSPNGYSQADDFFITSQIAIEHNLLQTVGKTNKFRGKEYIEFQEAVSILQACLSDVDSDDGTFKKYSMEFIKLFAKAHLSGIISPLDSGYLSIMNPKLKRKDVYILLARLLNSNRYHYFMDTGFLWTCPNTDKNRSMKYEDFLKHESGWNE